MLRRIKNLVESRKCITTFPVDFAEGVLNRKFIRETTVEFVEFWQLKPEAGVNLTKDQLPRQDCRV